MAHVIFGANVIEKVDGVYGCSFEFDWELEARKPASCVKYVNMVQPVAAVCEKDNHRVS